MTTLFVSDLHIEVDRPDIANQFLQFLETEALNADALYILGDLFEFWVGDDDPNEHYAWIKQGLRKLTKKNIPVFFMHGNRDFMIGQDFADETGITILTDPYIVEVHGENVLLSHGDIYCTDDIQYQAVRKMTRDPKWQATMLTRSLEERISFSEQARADSKAHGDNIDQAITDVNQAAIKSALRQANVTLMLHGHTHRPAVHEIEVDGKQARRIVLGDWYEHGSVVRWDRNGPVLSSLAR
ncbi:MAG: UDP-2,3-diacylglucosamine diphosphatase [Proteobacteria bacterium]|nr:UDP-2,3-diacylglucosamine diphosphatase [Pseudomonadota bacterium]MDA0993942.1 UDP-2,3-diacylglucosamine diphosphatase [Pseudomonadota bacterium]